MSFCIFGCSDWHPLNPLHEINFLYISVFTILYLIIGIKLKINYFYKDINKLNLNSPEDNKDNNYKIVTSNDMN